MSVQPADMYRRPSRERIAEQVAATHPEQPAAPVADAAQAAGPDDVVAWFGAHARAGLAARGWLVRDLAERAGDTAGNVSQALNGAKCPLALAGRIAAAFGIPLAEMVVPYACRTCAGYGGSPPKGTACLECGAETRAS